MLNIIYEYACNDLMQRMAIVGADWTLHPWHHNSSNVWGVIAGQARHNSSNVGGVTAGKVGHNSSEYSDL